MKDRKAVTLAAHDVVNGVREYSTSQANLWQQVPWLALEANGRDGLDGRLSNAFENGIWLVQSPLPAMNSGHAVYVDLLNGDLICTNDFHLRGRITPVVDGIALAFALDLGRLDASAVVATLRQMADREHRPNGGGAEAWDKWREEARELYGLQRQYTAARRREIPG